MKVNKRSLMWFFAGLLLVACDNQDNKKDLFKQSDSVDSEQVTAKDYQWHDYIAFRTQGAISRKARISISFLSPVTNDDQTDLAAEDFLTIEPKIKGKMSFINSQEIELIPFEPLPSGQQYKATLTTKGLNGFPEALAVYEFQFSVIKQAFEVVVDGINAEDNSDTVSISGRITTADVEDSPQIEKVLFAAYLNSPIDIKWQHAENGKSHRFIIPAIKRQKNVEKLLLNWDGESISVNDGGQRGLEIPAIGEFKVANIRAIQSGSQFIEVSFTEKLSDKQNLKGLIGINQGRFNVRQEGSIVKIYPNRVFQGEITVTINEGIKNNKGFRLGESVQKTLTFMSQKPQVKFVGKGVILPNNVSLTVPFEAVNVDSIQVTAFKVYANNMGQFLQSNNLDENYNTYQVGRYLWRKTISLESPVQDNWNRYSLDVSKLLKEHPGSMFRLTLSINRSNSMFLCSKEENEAPVIKEKALQNNNEEDLNENSSWDFAESYYNYNNQVKWNERKNPCKEAYYRYAENVKTSRNFLASNIGIIAKQGSNKKLILATTNIQTGLPWAQVKLDVFNFQHQLMTQITSDKKGLVEIELDSPPFYVQAHVKDEIGYLKLSSGRAIPTSHFDVGGVKVKQGIKGYLYGERGVWRPGDDIFITFVLEDKNQLLPKGHPVSLDFINPKGQLISSQTNNQPVDGFYAFKLKTDENAITGNWKVIARLGGLSFHKRIKVEAVIPNRLKVELKTNDKSLIASNMPVETQLFSQWLHGAKASNLKADVKVRLLSTKTKFNKLHDFIFDDPAREFHSEKQDVFSGNLDAEGQVTFKTRIQTRNQSPGMLKASFISRVFEDSGAFSTEHQSMIYHPYDNYLGIKLPKGDSKRNMLLTDTMHKVQIASLSAQGEETSLKEIEISLFKINWKWWWDKSGESLARYASSYSTNVLQKQTIFTNNGMGEWEFEIKYPQWGRYMIRACDKRGGHCTGEIFYIDWPGWAGRAKDQKGIGASVINLSSDKKQYNVGETATINLPPSKQGKALVSIENGSQILEQFWTELSDTNSKINIPLTVNMSPNIYVSVMLIQPHEGKDNDLPIRLFGIIPVMVNDPATALSPKLTVADEVLPQSTVEVKVSESQGKEMTYTLAIVDEGLLGLTRYKTPELRKYFYKKEALGVKTWDMFDDVIGAYGGELEKILALGGDGSEKDDEEGGKKKRFPPVVKFLGPFHLNSSETASHKIDIPQYLGAVRVMLVAGYDGAYGSDKKSVFVRQPVNVLATVPRVIAPDEVLTVPVAVFVDAKALGEVVVKVEVDDHFELIGENPIRLTFDEPSNQLGFIQLKVKSKLGKGHLRFSASNGKHKSQQDIYLDVRSANPMTTRQTQVVLSAGEVWKNTHQPHGLPSTNQLTLELSRVPPLNLESRLNYLIRYPHGCVEQTTSSVFPQLYLNDLISLEQAQSDQVENNIAMAIDKLRGFQLPSGGFVYWPGQAKAHSWGSNYVGHFLIEAKAKGYQIPASMLDNWASYQKSAANSWITGDDLSQSYRLFTLALAGKPALGAMNRLREKDNLSNVSRWYLAAAYQKVGQTDAAQQLVSGLSFEVEEYPRAGNSFGSKLRDQAIILESAIILGDEVLSQRLVEAISKSLASSRWLSTQSTAYALNAMSHYVFSEEKGTSNNTKTAALAAYKIAQQPAVIIKNSRPIWKQAINVEGKKELPVEIRNQSPTNLYVTLHAEGLPPAGEEKAENKGLEMEVDYFSAKGDQVRVDQLVQGEDIKIQVTINNDTKRDFKNLALTQILPSGWEIHNQRMEGEAANKKAYDYQDIRDDRILTYFDLKAKKEKTFNILINATYLGKFYLPGYKVEAMYDASKFAKSKGRWVEVLKQP